MDKKIKIAIICGFGKYYGSGHFIRMKVLDNFLKENLYYSRLMMIEKKNDFLDLPIEDFDIIIKDTRDGNKKIEKKLKDKFLITFDDYYKYNNKNINFLYYINSLPSIKNFGNITSFDFVLLNENSYAKIMDQFSFNNYEDNFFINFKDEITILVSFGTLDPKKMVLKFLKLIIDDSFSNYIINNKIRIVILKPKYILKNLIDINKILCKKNFNFIKFIEDENEYYFYLRKCDIFISHPGLSLYEAIKLNKKCIIISPTRYHNIIAEKNFSKINSGILSNILFLPIIRTFLLNKFIKRLKNIIKDEINQTKANFEASIKNNIVKFNEDVKKIILKLISNIEKKKNFIKICPFCLSNNLYLIYLSEKYNLLICNKCKSIIKDDIFYNEIEKDTYIDENYFDSNYKERYGKTYLQDRNNIRNINIKRSKLLFELIKKFFIKRKKNYLFSNLIQNNKKVLKILDIGCGYGFLLEDFNTFLSPQLRKLDLNTEFYGIEINPLSKNFVPKFINLYNCDFESFYNNYILKSENNLKDDKFDIISATFLIEHIFDVEDFINKVSKILNNNGILFLAFPNSYGPTFYFNKEKFFNTRPIEHYYDISLKGIKKLLKRHNIKVIKINIPEHHYLRWKEKNKILSLFIKKKFYNFIAGKIGFSDTIEVYCIKNIEKI
ncbi:MAG: methyltransferase domain-containing protein [Spirochaetes bacterium]|nr:methyltransferase domain-containing protein [Spirochaetota bacterium]